MNHVLELQLVNIVKMMNGLEKPCQLLVFNWNWRNEETFITRLNARLLVVRLATFSIQLLN